MDKTLEKVIVEFTVDRDSMNNLLWNTPNVTAQDALTEFLNGARWAEDEYGDSFYEFTEDVFTFKIVESVND